MTSDDELDVIMLDLITGHNFDYARAALIKWRNEAVTEALRLAKELDDDTLPR